jgi:hypothetical protein
MHASTEAKKNVLDLLQDLCGPDSQEALKKLFWSRLSYERVNTRIGRTGWTDTARKALAEDPVLFASGG